MPLYKSSEFGQVFAIVWFDDIIIPGGNSDVLIDVKESFMRFKIDGYEVCYRGSRVQVCKQGKYVEKILDVSTSLITSQRNSYAS